MDTRLMATLATRCLSLFLFTGTAVSLSAQPVRERVLLDESWQFACGNASSPEKDFGCRTEYFNYLTKAASNEGPYLPGFDATKWNAAWKTVNLPHDWVVDLPYAPDASHSYGYKIVGYQYPETSVGWHRKSIVIPEEDLGKHFYLQFDGIFRDATLEEGWFYEGTGIYHHVWLHKTAPLHVAPFGTFVHSTLTGTLDKVMLTIETNIQDSCLQAETYTLRHILRDSDGKDVAHARWQRTIA